MRNIPRRSFIHLLTPAEFSIREAMIAVEAAGCDPMLTDVVNLLQKARDKMADYVDRELEKESKKNV